MRIKDIAITSYRNIASAHVELGPGANVLYGANANGKTNALECMYMFAVARPFRDAQAADLVRHGETRALAAMRFEREGRDRGDAARFSITVKKQRQFVMNGAHVSKVSEFIGFFRAVLFTPDHLALIKGAPENRRRFLDMAIAQLRPVYISCLSAYSNVLSQRNALLKLVREGRAGAAELEVWTQKLAEYGSAVTAYRAEYMKKLSASAPGFYVGLSGAEGMDLGYYSQAAMQGADPGDAARVREVYAALYRGGTDMEIKQGMSLFGPHRDDITVKIGGHGARSMASQGQQRSAVLAMKLAEGEISKEICGEYPVFLLDDILSELDRGRQRYIMDSLGGRQVVVTCCSPEVYGISADAAMFEVRAGEITRVR